MAYVVAAHSGGGSMSEAMDSDSPVVVETLEEAQELWSFYNDNFNSYGEDDVRYFEIPATYTLEDAKAYWHKQFADEDEDEESEPQGSALEAFFGIGMSRGDGPPYKLGD